MKKRGNKDERIAVNKLRTMIYLILLTITSVLNVCFLFLAVTLWESLLPGELVTFILSAFAILSSALLVLFVWLIYRRFIIRPLDVVRESARKVAAGDFSVRIPPHRKDGKKDEFQVLYDDFNRMTEELASTEMLKSDFVSTVSHELKTPLSVIQNYATILQSDGISDEERKQYATTVVDASRRLTELVTNILQLNRLENQNIPLQTSSFNLCEQLYGCMIGFERVWEEKGIDVRVDVAPDTLVTSDESLLRIVWNNLLANALKFTKEGGTVVVRAEQEESYTRVEVCDNGIGMTEAQMQHAFDKFYQADVSHATKGNGLGLALVRRIAALTGCTVGVESAVGQGSRFTVLIPRVQ